MSDGPSLRDLRRALLAETDPAPGMPDRVLAGFPPGPSGRRASWALGALALALTVLIVVTLVLTGRAFQRPSRPATTPAATAPPPAVSTRSLDQADFAADGSGWVLEREGALPGAGPVSVLRTTDRGATWTSVLQLDNAGAFLRAGPGGEALVYVTGFSGPTTPATSSFYSTSDGGAHWQRYPAPAQGAAGPLWAQDARELWMGVWEPPAGGAPTSWGIYHSTDAGRTWQRQATVDTVESFGSNAQGPIAFVDANRAVYIHADEASGPGVVPLRTFATSDGGARWQQVPVPSPPGQHLTSANAAAEVVAATPDGRVVLQVTARPRAYLSVSQDAGLHWSELRPLPAPGLVTVAGGRWVWLGRDGRIFASTDEGGHWAPAGSLPRGLTPWQVGFSSPTDGWATASYLGPSRANVLLVTADGGRTWRSIPPPHPFQPSVPCGDVAGTDVTVNAHARLTMLVNGRAQSFVPAGVGVTDGCRYRLFTADGTGTIDIATTPAERGRLYSLGDFLDVWGVADLVEAAGGSSRVAVRVDGRPYGGDPRAIPLRDGTQVVLVVTVLGTG